MDPHEPLPARPTREVRATYSADAIVAYQAYPEPIAVAALEAQRFVPPFRMERMTWIKPSFLWMMYRSGWGTKAGQERVLAIDLRRDGFDWALEHGTLSHTIPAVHGDAERWRALHRTSPVVVQWDPERDVALRPLPWRTIQVGLRGEAVRRYVGEWTVAIRDVTGLAHAVHERARAGRLGAARALCPVERPYPVPPSAAARLAVTA
jgi:hypothetical protein